MVNGLLISGATTYRYLPSRLRASSVSVKLSAFSVTPLNVSWPVRDSANVVTIAPNGEGPPVSTTNTHRPSFVICVQHAA